MESTVKQRIRRYIEHKGVSARQFCLSIGASPAFISNMVKSIQPDKMNSIINQYPDLNPGWLMTGEGEMLKQSALPTKLDTDVVINRDIFEKLSLLIDTVCSQQRTIEILVSRSEPKHNNLAASPSKE